jgi:Tfp pilus assembly protein PilO
MKGPNPKIFLVLTILTLVAGSGLSYMQYTGYSDAKADIEKLKAEAKDQGEVERELQEAIDRLNDTRGKLVHLEQSVAEMAYVPTLLKELENLGTQCGIKVTGVRPVPKQATAPAAAKDENGETAKKARKPYNELDIEVKGRGNYQAVTKFITGLTTFPKIVAARTVSLQPKLDPRNPAAKPALDVTIELRSFLFPADGSTPKVSDDGEKVAPKSINLSGRTPKLEGN